MEIHQITLLIISLSCLFSFSASRPYYSLSPASAPSPSASSSSVAKSFSVPQPEGNDNFVTFNIMPSNADPDLQDICGETDHPIECVTTTAPFLQENMVVEPVSILKVGIEAMNNKSKEGISLVQQLLMDPKIDNAVASLLDTCIEGYNTVVECNDKILAAIDAHDKYTVEMELSSNVDNAQICAQAFEEAAIDAPTQEIDSMLSKMVSNGLAITQERVQFRI